MIRTPARLTLSGLFLAAAALLGGCGPTPTNPNIVDPAQTRERYKVDAAICVQEANMDVPPTYGMERFETDPTIEAQATRFVANAAEDDENLDAFATCMQARGWRYKK